MRNEDGRSEIWKFIDPEIIGDGLEKKIEERG
jgi:hypothetical protein